MGVIIEERYWCPHCRFPYSFPESDHHSNICDVCGHEMEFRRTCEVDVEKQALIQEKIKREKSNPNRKPRIQCPYCGSLATSKISTIGKIASVGFFGLASSKLGKEWHCNKCGSNF